MSQAKLSGALNPRMNQQNEKIQAMKEELQGKEVVYSLEGSEIEDPIFYACSLLEQDVDITSNWLLYDDLDVTYNENGSAKATLTVFTDASNNQFSGAESVEEVQ